MAPLIIVFAVVIFIFAAVPVLINELYVKKNNNKPLPKNNIRKYDREVDSIHITSDLETERRRRLDQLKSLYEAGMMESDEYYERRQGIEDDFRR